MVAGSEWVLDWGGVAGSAEEFGLLQRALGSQAGESSISSGYGKTLRWTGGDWSLVGGEVDS